MLHAPRGEVVRGGSVGARTATQCVHLRVSFSQYLKSIKKIFQILAPTDPRLKLLLPLNENRASPRNVEEVNI